jgi:hypothetical protein
MNVCFPTLRVIKNVLFLFSFSCKIGNRGFFFFFFFFVTLGFIRVCDFKHNT